MKIILDKKAGFCFGVRRAIDLTEEEIKKSSKVYTFGPIIHNPQEVERLKRIGVNVVNELNDYIKGTVVIRTHGISPKEYEKLKEKCEKIIDGTCPLVKRSHEVVSKFKKEGLRIIIIGDKNHPEVKALMGYAGDNAIIIKDKNTLNGLPIGGKVGVLAQTTLSKENVQEILSYLATKVVEMHYYNTLCAVTLNQKKSAESLSKQVDVMIIVGGKNSSNTTKLAEVCKKSLERTYLIESADELDINWFKKDDTVGITGGASTPQWVLEEVIEALEKFSFILNNENNFCYEFQNK